MARKRKKLGEILVDWGIVTPDAVETALKFAKEQRKRIGQALVEMELTTEDDVTKALATQFDMEYVDLEHNAVVPGAMELIPHDIIRKHLVLPVEKKDDRLKVIIHDPLDLDTQDMLRFRLGTEIECCLAPKGKIAKFIDTFLSEVRDSIDTTMDELKGDDSGVELVDDIPQEEDDAPIIRLLNLLISEAVRSRASDIHIEPFTDRVRVRYRIDGVCVERDNIPKSMQGSVLSRLKIMAGIDIAQKRTPQDGRIKMKIDGSNIDFRVSTTPAYHGESVVLRVLKPESASVGVQSLGFEQADYDRFQKIIRRPNGIFLVTGPTGSGKTTTLYSALQELNRPDKKIITAEDPVEYNFAGMNQCQVREAIGLSFARILRAMLRQAPNIILVGEIRDLEVAEVAIQAALTGHLVFSTLHTNDAPSAVTRLIDMGVKPFLVASSVQAIMAQRLIRTICKDCRVEDPEPDKFSLQVLGITDKDLEGKTLYKGAGCSSCHNSGYRGRLGIFEMLEMNTQLRELAFERAPTNKLRQAARASGMRTLLEDGKLKIFNGITTAEEIARITQAEGLVDLAEVS